MAQDARLRAALTQERTRRREDALAAAWSCPDCATTDGTLRYRSGKLARCYDCQRWQNLQAKCTRSRARHAASRQPGLLTRPAVIMLDRAQYLGWCRSSPRVCHYCAITQDELPFAAVLGSNGRPTEAMGLDRLDNDRDYELGNLAWCCAGCNGIKSNRFTDAEMRELALAAARVYRARVLRALNLD